MPRVLAIAQDLLQAVEYRYSDQAFSAYVAAFQTVTGLNMDELSLLIPALKLVVLEEFVNRGREVVSRPEEPQKISDLMGSMRDLSEAPWKELLEPLIVFDAVLAAGSRESLYAHGFPEPRAIPPHGDSLCRTLRLFGAGDRAARDGDGAGVDNGIRPDPRLAWRKSHVGYYLIAEGAKQLRPRAGVRLPFSERVQDFLRRHPEEFYLGGVELLTLLIVHRDHDAGIQQRSTRSWVESSPFSFFCFRPARARSR